MHTFVEYRDKSAAVRIYCYTVSSSVAVGLELIGGGLSIEVGSSSSIEIFHSAIHSS